VGSNPSSRGIAVASVDLAVGGRRGLLQRRGDHIEEVRVPIRGFPQKGVGDRRGDGDRPMLEPEERENRSEEPDHRIHDRQPDELWWPD